MTIPQALAQVAQRHGSRPAILGAGVALTHAELDRCVQRAAADLAARGVKPGDVVGVSLPTSPLHLVTLLGLARAGACSVHVNPEMSREAKDALLAQFGIDLVVTPARAEASWLVPGKSKPQPDLSKPDAPWRIALSSGTTGLQKATRTTHAAMLADIENGFLTVPLAADDRFMCHRGLDSAWALNWVLSTLVEGGAIVFPDSLSVPHFIEAAKRHRATRLIMPPVFMRQLVERMPAGSGGLPDVRSLVVGGSAPPADVFSAALERVSPHVFNGYGATELGLVSLAGPDLMRSKPRSAGRLQPGYEAEAVDESGARLPPGQKGELRFRRPGMVHEYFRNPQATARGYRDGWFHPGDTGRVEADGMLYIEGRVDDLLNLDGRKVEPAPVEAAIASHPAVKEAAVFVAAPEGSRTRLFAAAVLREPVEEKVLLEHCRQRVGDSHTPLRIFFSDDLPRNEGGKLVRAKLASRVAKSPGAGGQTIPALLAQAARHHGARPALLAPGLTLTHAGLDACARRAAVALEKQGVRPGKVVGVALETSPLHLVTLLGLARTGACAVFVNPAHPPAVREAMRAQLGIHLLVGDAPGALAVSADWLNPEGAPAHESRAQADTPWRIGLSSGTTGLQKAVLFTQAQSAAYLKLHNAALPAGPDDCFLCHRGLDSGLTVHAILCHLVEGGRVAFPASRTLENFIEAVDRHAPTQAVLSPAYLRDLVEHLKEGGRPRFPSFTLLRVAGSMLPPPLYEAGVARVSPNLIATYGATELGVIALADREIRRRAPRSVGRLAPGLEGQAVDEAGKPVRPGESGALRFRREGMPREYIRNPEASARTFRDGWIYPGDRGRFDAGGLLYIEGRVDDKLNLGGMKIEPAPIEQALHEHPSVMEAVVFAAAPAGAPPAVFAAVVPRVPVEEKELLAHCRGRLGPQFTPVRIFFIDRLPRNEAGKVLRAELAQRVARRPG